MHVNIHIDTSKVNLGKRLFINAYTHKMTSTLAYQNKQTTNKQIHTTCSHGSCRNITAMQWKPKHWFRPNQEKEMSWKPQLPSCCYSNRMLAALSTFLFRQILSLGSHLWNASQAAISVMQVQLPSLWLGNIKFS